MTYVITKDFAFSASHVLKGLPDGHPCGRLHGHNYVVRVELSSEQLDDTGFVMDYGKLKPFQQYVDYAFDHQHLNDVWPGANPTAENLAAKLREQLPKVVELPDGVRVAVGVSETPKTWAWSR